MSLQQIFGDSLNKILIVNFRLMANAMEVFLQPRMSGLSENYRIVWKKHTAVILELNSCTSLINPKEDGSEKEWRFCRLLASQKKESFICWIEFIGVMNSVNSFQPNLILLKDLD